MHKTTNHRTPAAIVARLIVLVKPMLPIMAAIRGLAGKKTVILISHRLANVVDSDCIYVLDKGRIAERGTHAELLKKQGAYSRLYMAQKQLETLETEDA